MAQRLKVQDHTNLERDMHSGGIVNTSKSDYINFMEARNKRLAERHRVQSMCDEINSLKNEMQDIKEMLRLVLEK